MKATAPIFDKFTKITAEDDDQTDQIGSFSQQLVMKDIHFSYKDHIILKGASLRIEKRHKYALVGPSGAGKSTVLNLLNTKLVDYQGSILIDDQDYKNLNAAAIREQIYYLDQDPYIFNDTIENNIKVGQQTTAADLQKAIKRAGLTSFIKKMPDGLQTILSHNGSDLSGGQKQRLVLARGLVSGRSIFLVDEGTSALDQASAIKIEDTLIQDPNLTLLMVTHHLRDQTASQLDQVFQLHEQLIS